MDFLDSPGFQAGWKVAMQPERILLPSAQTELALGGGQEHGLRAEHCSYLMKHHTLEKACHTLS